MWPRQYLCFIAVISQAHAVAVHAAYSVANAVAYAVAAHSANAVAVLSANAVDFHLGYAGAVRFCRRCCQL